MVIDFGIKPPVELFMGDFFKTPKHLESYKKVYGSRIDEAEHFYNLPTEEFIKHLDDAGVTLGVIRGEDNEVLRGKGNKIPNDAVADFVNKYPDKFMGIAGIDPLKRMDAVREIEWAVKDLGLKGVVFESFEFNLYPDDRICYPIYAKCVELDVPLLVHSSINFSNVRRMDYSNPRYWDTVLADFPELKVVGLCPGWPWVNEYVALAWRYPNFYLATNAVRPLYLGAPNSGYEQLVAKGNNVISNKIIFGSGWPLLPVKRSIEEIKALPLKDNVKEKWLYKNAARLFKLDIEK